MADVLLPPWLTCVRVTFRYVDSTGLSIAEFTGAKRTAAKGGDRLAATLEFTPTGTSSAQIALERAILLRTLAALRGRQNRIYLTNPARRLRGAFPTSELASNNTFANGTTGWGTPVQGTLGVSDRKLRLTFTAAAGVSNPSFRQSIPVTQFVPYVARAMLDHLQVRGGASTAGVFVNTGLGGFTVSQFVAQGLTTVMSIAVATGTLDGLLILRSGLTGFVDGDYMETSYMSMASCALVDNRVNALLWSDEIDNAAWTKQSSTVTANGNTAPNGLVLADRIIEDITLNSHGVTQSTSRTAAIADLCSYGYFRQSTGTRNIRLTAGNDGTNFGSAIFDLSNGTIAAGPTNNGTATLTRAFIITAGNSWYFCAVVSRAASASTMALFAQLANGTTMSYTGDGTSSVAAWRVGMAVSGVPTLGALTVGTALPTGTAQSGSAMHVKGLPPSTNDLLLPGDEFETITTKGSELKICTAALNSDAAGLGHVQFEPPLRGASVDNSPIIIHEPMMRAIFNGDLVGWDHAPGVITTASAEFEEA